MGWIVQVVDWLNVCEYFSHFDVDHTFKRFFSSLIYVNTKLFLLIADGLLNGFAFFLFYFISFRVFDEHMRGLFHC